MIMPTIAITKNEVSGPAIFPGLPEDTEFAIY